MGGKYQISFLVFFVLAIAAIESSAQLQPPDLQVKFKSKASYAAAEPKVLAAANYVLGTNSEAEGRDECTQFILNWMDGTKDYTFNIDASLINSDRPELLSLYLASAAKYVIEKKSSADEKEITLNAVRTIIAWCIDPVNNSKLPLNFQKYQQADQEGKLAEALNLN
jgi:hypothetical protein